ncbi:MAG: hypothetical protein KFF73_01200 [Cyclobacteriaceae bacterium]|nr:hypothetical protein [Cyclobacteriaceae bacterium]
MAWMLWGCSSVQPPIQITDSNVITPEEDKTEYEIEILDPGFNTWFMTQWNLAKDRSYQFYDTWNDRYVQAWNYKATSSQYGRFFTSTINYDTNEDYGMEVSRELFYYFQYVENKLNIPILN